MKSKGCAGIVFLMLLFSAAGASAQQAEAPGGASDNTIRLAVAVTAKNGAEAPALRQQDFTVLDNNVNEPLTSFKVVQNNSAPTEVVLVIDAVNIGYERLAYERDEIGKFLVANGGHLAHPTAIAIFTDTGVQIQQGFSTDGNALSDLVKKQNIGLRDIRRSAGFYGADDRLQLSLAALHMLAAREEGRPGHKVVLWVSPGWPLLSGPHVYLDNKQEQQIFGNVMSFSNELRKARITLYSIDPLGAGANVLRTFYYQQFVKGVSKPSQVSLGDLGLQVLAIQSGGFALNSSNDVSKLLQQCVDDTERYYELSFQPTPGEPGEYHHIVVKLADPGLVARTRDGYYSQP